MSFILDALRKAEHRRQARDLPALVQPTVTPEDIPGAPLELGKIAFYGVGALVLAGAGVVFALKGNDSNVPTVPLSLPPPSSVNIASQNYTDVANLPPSRPSVKVSNARALDREPQRGGPRSTPAATQSAVTTITSSTPTNAPPAARMPSQPAPSSTGLPEYYTVAASGRVNLPPLHVDMHVYSSRQEKRFVIINLSKYREGDAMKEGGRIEAITPDGVIVNHNGLRFVLRSN